MSKTARRPSPFWRCALPMALSACPLAPALAGAPGLLEHKFLDVGAGLSFDNASHLANAIDLGAAPGVAVNGLRGVWGVQGDRAEFQQRL